MKKGSVFREHFPCPSCRHTQREWFKTLLQHHKQWTYIKDLHIFQSLFVSKGSESDSDEVVPQKKKSSPMAPEGKEINSDDEFDHFYDWEIALDSQRC